MRVIDKNLRVESSEKMFHIKVSTTYMAKLSGKKNIGRALNILLVTFSRNSS